MFRTRLGTVLMPYPWIVNSSSSSSQKRRLRCTGIIIIHMVSMVFIGQCIIHRTRHTILIVTSSRMDVTLSSFHPVIPTNTAPLYRTTTIFHRSDTTTSTLHLLHSTPYCTRCEGGSLWGWLVVGWEWEWSSACGETTTSSSPSSNNICHAIHTNNIIIYNNQQQQKNKKERGKECY